MTLLRRSLCPEHTAEQVQTVLGMFERAGKAVGTILTGWNIGTCPAFLAHSEQCRINVGQGIGPVLERSSEGSNLAASGSKGASYIIPGTCVMSPNSGFRELEVLRRSGRTRAKWTGQVAGVYISVAPERLVALPRQSWSIVGKRIKTRGLACLSGEPGALLAD